MAYGNKYPKLIYNKETKTWKPRKKRYFKVIKSTQDQRDKYNVDDVPEYLRKYL